MIASCLSSDGFGARLAMLANERRCDIVLLLVESRTVFADMPVTQTGVARKQPFLVSQLQTSASKLRVPVIATHALRQNFWSLTTAYLFESTLLSNHRQAAV